MRIRILSKLYELKGNYVSGGELADELGISSVAIWKHIAALKQEGYDITGVSGQGYRLSNWYNLIIPNEVIRLMPESKLIKQIFYYPILDSTNKLAKELANNHAEEGLVIVAGRQEDGKGRIGRKWDSPAGGIWFSLILRPRLALPELALLSLVFSVAVAKALKSFLAKPVQVKWPNDVLVGGKKLAGILLEVSGQVDNVDNLVVGIGLNVNMGPGDMDINNNMATSLLIENKHEIINNEVLSVVLYQIEEYYTLFLADGFGQIRQEFKDMCLHLGENVSINQFDRVVTGRNIDIDKDGNMLLEVDGELVRITTGDVQVI